MQTKITHPSRVSQRAPHPEITVEIRLDEIKTDAGSRRVYEDI